MADVTPDWTHLLYQHPEGQSLCQGDVLKKTPEVAELLRVVHPHYLGDTYTHFQVVTRTCDLVRRKRQEPKARYITLAAVRPFHLAVERELAKHQDKFGRAGAMAPKGVRGRLHGFIRSVMNNDRSDYFFLPADAAAGIVEDSAAFLPLTIAIRRKEHYEKCLKARVLSLREIFQAKLGSLLGEHYSRVGTPDYVGEAITPSECKDKGSHILDGICFWADDEKYTAAKRNATADDYEMGQDRLRELTQQGGPASDSDRVLNAVVKALNDLNVIDQAGADEDVVRSRIAAEPAFRAILASGK